MNKQPLRLCTPRSFNNPLHDHAKVLSVETGVVILPQIFQIGIDNTAQNLLTMDNTEFVHFLAVGLEQTIRAQVPDDATGYAFLNIEPRGWLQVLHGSDFVAIKKFATRIIASINRAKTLFPKLQWTAWGLPRTPAKGAYKLWMSHGQIQWNLKRRGGNNFLVDTGLFDCFEWYTMQFYWRSKVLFNWRDPRVLLPRYATVSDLERRVTTTMEECGRIMERTGRNVPVIPSIYCRYENGTPWAWSPLPTPDMKIIAGSVSSSGLADGLLWWHQYTLGLEWSTKQLLSDYVRDMRPWLAFEELTT